MNSIDIAILGLASAITLYLIAKPTHGRSSILLLIGVLLVLLILQFLGNGFYWQYVPTYLLIFFVGIAVIFAGRTRSKLHKTLFQTALSVFLLISIVPWVIFPAVPTLTKPRGQYVVGTRLFRWIDSARAEGITKDPRDKRNVIVQAWYPTEVTANGARSRYLDGLGHLPAKVGFIPRFIFNHYDQINTYGILNAPVNKARKQWPVVIFLTGYGGTRAVYTSLSAGLASHGYVVLSIDHPYEAPIVELANGKLVTTIEEFSKDAPDRTQFMKDRLNIRTADVAFIIQQLDQKAALSDRFFSLLDRSRIVIAGHSLGGASAAVAMANDVRIKAAVNLDGTLYGELPVASGPRPFLLVESNKQEIGRFLRYEAGNQRLFKQFKGGYRYELTGADHYSFTDVPLFLTPMARMLVGRMLTFGQLTTITHTATVDILDAFFNSVLYGKPFIPDKVTAHYQGIIRKPIAQ